MSIAGRELDFVRHSSAPSQAHHDTRITSRYACFLQVLYSVECSGTGIRLFTVLSSTFPGALLYRENIRACLFHAGFMKY